MRIVLIAPLALLALLAPAAALPAEPAHVLAAGFSFTPPVVHVGVGEPVTWEGLLATHTVTTSVSLVNAAQGQADDRQNADADPDTFHVSLPAGATFTHSFSEPGIVSYFCALHFRSGMIGTVVVEE